MPGVKRGLLALALLILVPVLAIAGPPPTQPGALDDSGLQKLADDYAAAWAKGDAAAIAALYTVDGIYVDVQGRLKAGRSEIEAGFKEWFGGVFKNSTIVIHPGQARQVAADVVIGEGTWQVSGGAAAVNGLPQRPEVPAGAPTTGRYLNTMVRHAGQWRIAGTASVPQPPSATAAR